MIVRIQPAIMNYAWGSRDRTERLLGIADPAGAAVAELWYGSHPRGPARIVGMVGAKSPTGGVPVDGVPASGDSPQGEQNLRQILKAQAPRLLGEAVFRRYGAELPFLFKVLSAEKGLSIQAHPEKKQAENGFDRETAQGINIAAPERNYRDRNHKPECLVALENFWALSGFRAVSTIAEHLFIPSASPLLQKLTGILAGNSDTKQTVQHFYSTLMNAYGSEQRALLNAVLEHISAEKGIIGNAASCPQYYWVQELNRQFPGDPGCLAPLYLNVLQLMPGQALFMKAGILHAYLRGTGLEIMANSDNVLRGGCTEKHVDIPELLSILDFQAEEPMRPKKSSQGWYESPVPEFQLAWMDIGAAEQLELRRNGGLAERMAIILITQGSLSLNSDDYTLTLNRGESAFLSAGSEGVQVRSSLGASYVVATVNRVASAAARAREVISGAPQ